MIEKSTFLLGFILLLSFFSKAQYSKNTGKYLLASIDTVGPYYVLHITTAGRQKKDKLSILSLINPDVPNINLKGKQLLKIGRLYHLEVQAMNSFRVSKNSNVEALINLRSQYIDDKLLLKAGEFPYKSKNIYKLYYLPNR